MPESLPQGTVWKKAIRNAAAPERVRDWLKQLAPENREPLGRLNAEEARILAALFSGSHSLSATLIKHPEWLNLFEGDLLLNPRREQGLRREVNGSIQPLLQNRDYAEAFTRLRLFQQRELLRIAARDLGRIADAIQTTLELSNVADICLSAVLEICFRQLTERFGTPYHKTAQDEWVTTPFAIIGLGKLGGQELNYSSDVDIVFVYADEGHVFKEPPRKTTRTERALTSHQYFNRLVEAVVTELTRATPEGMLYRVDLRLRPEGDSGPLGRSLPGYENFYSQWGQTWERMMLIKARGVAGDQALATEFQEMIQPFRFPRSIPLGALREIAEMKQRMEKEVVKANELERNVKLGRGGIREIEFIVQSSQLIHGGRMPFLQGRQTLPALEKMVQYNLIDNANAQALSAAYRFLRDVEHRLQMENNLQTHTIPDHRQAQERLSRLMGFSEVQQFKAAYRTHTNKVREQYAKFLPIGEAVAESALPRGFDGKEETWKNILAEHGFKRVADSLRYLKEFVQGPGYVHVSRRTEELAWQLISKFLQICRGGGASVPASRAELATVARENAGPISDPDRVLARLDSFISAYGARAMMFESWTSNPSLFELLLLLFDRSEFLAEQAIRTPDLVEDLVLSGRLDRTKTAEETLAELRHGAQDPDQKLWIRRYHQAEFMRIGLRDILGLADAEQNLIELSALADACLQYALEVVHRKQKFKSPRITVIGLGKLGGQEITYGSDLDIIFVAPDQAKDLPKLQRLAIDLMDLLSSQTTFGIAFVTDARLRPDGEKGLLVNILSAYEEYYRSRAQLWEIQALSRARPIAGDQSVGEEFCDLARALTNFKAQNASEGFPVALRSSSKARAAGGKSRKRAGLTAYAADWKQQIARMRQRIEKERTTAGHAELAIKTGAGGLIDAEFIAQTVCLENGWLEPNTLRALEKAREEKVLSASDGARLIDNFRQLRRVESILRRWSFEGEAELPADPAAFRRVSIRCGFSSPEEFRRAVAGYRQAIREVYSKIF